MTLLLTVPSGVLIDEEVTRIVTDTDRGAFCLLPRHADTVMLVVPGLLLYRPLGGADDGHDDVVVAVDDGVLVKAGDSVRVASQRAVVAGDLGNAEATVREHFRTRSEHEKRARTALSRLEADIVRRLGELRR